METATASVHVFPQASDLPHPGDIPSKNGASIVDGPEDVDYEAAAPTLLSFAHLDPEGEEKTFKFKLHQTSIKSGQNIYARVRIIDVTDRALQGMVAPNVRESIQKLWFSGDTNQTKKNVPAKIRAEQQTKRHEQVKRTYACAGFIEPKLVMTEAEERPDQGIIWVGRMNSHDLSEFIRVCEGDESLAEQRLSQFSE